MKLTKSYIRQLVQEALTASTAGSNPAIANAEREARRKSFATQGINLDDAALGQYDDAMDTLDYLANQKGGKVDDSDVTSIINQVQNPDVVKALKLRTNRKR